MMKRLNRKGFTLIELLAVIVVLAIILVITVPMVLNSLSSTRADALQASANSVAKYIEEQIGLAQLDRSELFTVDTDLFFDANGKLCASGSSKSGDTLTCKSTGSDVTLNSFTNNSLFGLSGDYDLTNSKAKWDNNGRVTVTLVGAANQKFDGITKTSNN